MRFVVPAAVALVLALPASASAETSLRGSIEWIDPVEDVADPKGHNSNIIFLNRCAGGCTITPGPNDSRNNRSSIIGGQTRQISEFSHGDAAWNEVVSCVTRMYEPYNIVVTDVDPGSQSHFESIVAGFNYEIGSDAGGVSPFTCGTINNAINFSFANQSNSMAEICWTVAQESAHSFGLEHEFLCEDPMTYLTGCGAKVAFQDVNAQCGEDAARQCWCTGGSTQNSHALLLGHFGPGSPTPPTVNIVRPMPNESVNPGFVIEVMAEDNVEVDRVELYINGRFIVESGVRPFFFNAPIDTSGGYVDVEVRAYDNRDAAGSGTVRVLQGEPCTENSCAADEVCFGGSCIPGPTTPGGLGAVCAGNDDCGSNICGTDAEGTSYCTQACDEGSCPSGFRCIDDGAAGLCWPGGGSGGCSVGTARGSNTLPLFLLFLTMLALRRRRTSSDT